MAEAIPVGREAVRRWQALPAATRREVRRLARNGQPHPDPLVTPVAVGWARVQRHRLVAHMVALFATVMLVHVSSNATVVRAAWPWPLAVAAVALAGVVALGAALIVRTRVAPMIEAVNAVR